MNRYVPSKSRFCQMCGIGCRWIFNRDIFWIKRPQKVALRCNHCNAERWVDGKAFYSSEYSKLPFHGLNITSEISLTKTVVNE